MAFEMRLVAIDLDGTLVVSKDAQLANCPNDFVTIYFGAGPMYVYTRPYMAKVLVDLYNDFRNVVVLFSAGSYEYVHEVVDAVIAPAARAIEPDWDFMAVYTGLDIADGNKNIGKLCSEMKLSRSILIDDMMGYCTGCQATCYERIDTYDPMKPGDDSLLYIMDNIFFMDPPFV